MMIGRDLGVYLYSYDKKNWKRLPTKVDLKNLR